jgi:hypothetical protein
MISLTLDAVSFDQRHAGRRGRLGSGPASPGAPVPPRNNAWFYNGAYLSVYSSACAPICVRSQQHFAVVKGTIWLALPHACPPFLAADVESSAQGEKVPLTTRLKLPTTRSGLNKAKVMPCTYTVLLCAMSGYAARPTKPLCSITQEIQLKCFLRFGSFMLPPMFLFRARPNEGKTRLMKENGQPAERHYYSGGAFLHA